MAISRDPDVDQDLLEELEAIGHRWPQRLKESYTHPGCAEFTADRRLSDPVFLMREFQLHPEIWNPSNAAQRPSTSTKNDTPARSTHPAAIVQRGITVCSRSTG
jgi:hypothetical protein